MRNLAFILALLLGCAPAFAQQGPNIDTGSGGANLITFSSTAGSQTINSSDMQNEYNHGVSCIINQNGTQGPLTLNVVIQGKDLASANYYTLASTGTLSPQTTVPLYRIAVFPGLTAQAGGSAGNVSLVNDFLPKVWRVSVALTGTNATFTTGSIGCSAVH